MGLAQGVGVDGAESIVAGAAQGAAVNQLADDAQDHTLLSHVSGAVLGAGENEFPCEAHAFAFEHVEIDGVQVAHNAYDCPLGFNQLRHHVPIGVGVAEIGDHVDFAVAQGC